MWKEKLRPPLHLFKSSFFCHLDTKKYQNFLLMDLGGELTRGLLAWSERTHGSPLCTNGPFQPVCRDSVPLNGPWTRPRPPPSMVLSRVKQHGDGMKSRVKSVTFHHILREKHARCLCFFVYLCVCVCVCFYTTKISWNCCGCLWRSHKPKSLNKIYL